MKIQCEQCKIEYNIDDAAIGERGIRAQCPRCNFITTIRKSQPAILDQARAKLDETAICVNCGKPTVPTPGDPIPICANCQAQSIDVGSKTNVQVPQLPAPRPSAPGNTPAMQPLVVPPIGAPPVAPKPSPSNGGVAPMPAFGNEPAEGVGAGPGEVIQWRIKKSPTGEVYGPFDRDLIQGWIDGDKIVPADEISRVGGPWRAAGEHEDFAAAFAARYGGVGPANGAAPLSSMPATDVRKTVGGGTGGRIVSPKLQTSNPLPWKGILAVAATFAVVAVGGGVWYTGAVAGLADKFRREPPPLPPDLTDKMIEQLRAQYPTAAGTAAEHIAAGHTAAAPDTVDAWTAARAEYAQALAIERKNVEALALIAEMNALLATYDQQTNLLDESLRFAVRAIDWDKTSPVAARARAASMLASGADNAVNANDARMLLESTVLVAMPDDPAALAMLGRSYSKSDPAKAEDILKKAMAAAPNMLRPRVELGLLYEKAHRYQRALDTFKPVLDRSFLSAYRTGKIDENVGSYREAAQAFKLAAQVAEPTGGRPWVDAVISYAVIQYQALGNVREASSALAPLQQKYLAAGATETLRSDQLSRLRLHLAIIARLSGDYAKSVEISRTVLADRDIEYSAAASFNIGLSAMRKGDFAEADKALDEALVATLDKRSKSEIYYWAGVVKMRRGEIQPSESAFEEAKKEDEQNWRAVVAHACLLGKSGERDIEAMAKMEDLAQIDPTFYEQYQRVTLFYPDPPTELLALGQKTFTRIHTTSHGTDARSSTSLGIVAYLSGNRGIAAQHISAALSEATPDPAAYVFSGLLAEAKGGKGNLDQALDRFTTAKSEVPSAFLSTAIGRVEVQRGNITKAMSDLQDALNRDPNYAPAHFWLGMAYQKKGDSRQAVMKWGDALKYDANFVRASRAMFEVDGPAS